LLPTVYRRQLLYSYLLFHTGIPIQKAVFLVYANAAWLHNRSGVAASAARHVFKPSFLSGKPTTANSLQTVSKLICKHFCVGGLLVGCKADY
jgi:hypothetical protein